MDLGDWCRILLVVAIIAAWIKFESGWVPDVVPVPEEDHVQFIEVETA